MLGQNLSQLMVNKHLVGLLLVISIFPAPFLSLPILPVMPANAQTQLSPQQVLERLFTAPQVQAVWFADSFLAQVPFEQVQPLITSLKTSLGAYREVRPDGKDYRVIFEKGSIPTKIVLDGQGKITGLLLSPPQLNAIAPKNAVQQFQQLPGTTSLLILQGDKELAVLNGDRSLAVGSAFKLAVLEALKQRIHSSKHTWSEVVKLDPQWKSLPSGFLQTWADGTSLTVETLATLMISISDNTATDGLLQLVGRKAVEKLAPRNRPFLSTHEAFKLKDPKNADLLKRYRAGNEMQRRQILPELAQRPLPGVDIFEPGKTVAQDVEWFFTTRELCQLMGHVADLPLMSINPGIANPKDWAKVSFKGGSEPGVMNLTTWLKAKNGKTYCVSATWNNTEPLNDARFTTLYSGVIEGLKQ